MNGDKLAPSHLELRHHKARHGFIANPDPARFREITRERDEAGSSGGRSLNVSCAVLRAPKILIDAMRRICSIALATCETPCRSLVGNGGQLRSVRLLKAIVRRPRHPELPPPHIRGGV